MKKTLLAGMAAALMMVGMVGTASATILTVGDPFNSGSWSEKFKVKEVSEFNRIETFVKAGNKLKSGIENIDKPDWKGLVERPDYSHAKDSDVAEIDFDIHFDGVHNDDKNVVITEPVDLIVLICHDDKVVEDIHAHYDGKDWGFEDHTGDHDHHDDDRGNCAPVPEPGTMMLVGFGMLGMAVYGKRRMNKQA
jgi:hypothetical protein